MEKTKILITFLLISSFLLLTGCGLEEYAEILGEPPNLVPARTIFAAPLINTDNALIESGESDEGQITLPFKNNLGSPIEIIDILDATDDCGGVGTEKKISIEEGSFKDLDEGIIVQNAERFFLKFTCLNELVEGEKFSSDITFEYKNTRSGLSRPHKGSVDGQVAKKYS